MALHRISLAAVDSTRLQPGRSFEVTGDEARHAVSVKRLNVSDAVELLDGQGLIARASIASMGKRSLIVAVEEVRRLARPRREIIVAVPPPKGPRAEWMIEQLSQVGVSRWIPLITARSVVEPRDKRLIKWRSATVVESAKQCGRAWFMDIDDPTPVAEVLARGEGSELWLADPAGSPPGHVKIERDENRGIAVLVGPEGGFTPAEREAIEAARATLVHLGPHILRLETAAVVGAAAAVTRLAAPA